MLPGSDVLLQYGAIGVIAALSIGGLVWSQRQFIGFLKDQVAEASSERGREREERQLWRSVVTAIQTTMSDNVRALKEHSEQEKEALDDVVRTLRELRTR